MKKIEILLKDSSKPIIRENVVNTYFEGPFFCIWTEAYIDKFPIANIFRVRDYNV